MNDINSDIESHINRRKHSTIVSNHKVPKETLLKRIKLFIFGETRIRKEKRYNVETVFYDKKFKPKVLKKIHTTSSNTPLSLPVIPNGWHIKSTFVLHKLFGPAIVSENETKEYFRKGKHYRWLGLPAVISKTERAYYKNGLLHRKFKPARYTYHDTFPDICPDICPDNCDSNDKKIKKIEYFINGKLHRKTGPARIEFDLNNNICTQQWRMFGKKHRENDEPAYFSNEYSGHQFAEYCLYGELHRTNGPALIISEKDIKCLNWYIHGVNLTEIYENII